MRRIRTSLPALMTTTAALAGLVSCLGSEAPSNKSNARGNRIDTFPSASDTVPVTSAPSIAEVAAHYQSYLKVTDQVVQVNPELAMLCVGASQSQVQKARETYGPHAHTGILVYMNDSAAAAWLSGKSYPVGSAVVKKKTMYLYRGPDGKMRSDAQKGVGGMVKRSAGYDPKNGDWEYFYFEDAEPVESGRIQSCVQCHAGARGTDYVFGTWKP